MRQERIEQFSGERVQDKRLQDLRVFALEYVKQIVAKASELSQERQEAKNAQKLAKYYACDSNQNTKSEGANGADNSGKCLRDAALQINHRFQLETRDQESVVAAANEAANRKRQIEEHRARGLTVYELDEEPYDSARARDEDLEEPGEQVVGARGPGRKRKERRLNWHLLLSCFSNCLPGSSIPPNAMSPSGPSAL